MSGIGDQRPEVVVFVCGFEEEMNAQLWKTALLSFSENVQNDILRYRKWEDRHRKLIGRLLLRKIFRHFDHAPDHVERLQYTSYDRPFIDGPLDFNLSHSGSQIMCAASLTSRVGVDVEAIRAIEWRDFRNYMTPEQWKRIHHAADSTAEFFNYWALKESVIKANGKGLSIPLDQLETDFRTIECEGQTWHLQKLDIAAEYPSWLASEQPAKIVRKNFEPEDLISLFA